MSDWFPTKGAAAQFAVGALGVSITFANAWPQLKQLQFLEAWPVVAYAALTIFLVAVLRSHSSSTPEKVSISPIPVAIAPIAASSTNTPKIEETPPQHTDLFSDHPFRDLKLRGGYSKVTLSKGNAWRTGSGTNEVRIIHHGLDAKTRRVRLEFRSFLEIVGGSLTAKNESHLLLPEMSENLLSRCIAQTIGFKDEGFLYFDLFGVDHINHSTEVIDLFVIRVRA